MNSEQWQNVKAIFNSALELKAEERDEYLTAACDGDESLRRRVQDLLDAYQSDFLEHSGSGENGSAADEQTQVLRPGQTLGRYEVSRLLGAGGMGEVYLARDPHLERKVCIKVFSQDNAASRAYLERFVREAQSASALNHPHICTIYEINTDHQPPFIAMEYIEGQTLDEKIRGERLDVGSAVGLVLQIADGLAEAHEAGIIHRDIKPANIIINKRGQAKIVDFGLAKRLVTSEDGRTEKNLTHSGMVVGTVSYMSPEQARGQAVDARTDVWSLGVLLCQMLTGKLPFSGDTSGDVIASILRSEPVIAARPAAMPRELETVIRKALAKDKTSRYSTAREFAADLVNARNSSTEKTRFLDHDKTTVAFKSDTEKERTHDSASGSPLRKYHKIVIAAAIVTSGLIAAYLLFTINWRSAPEIRSIAVLPLENLSGDSSQDYFADGMTEALISNLSQIGDLKVISRTSVMRYKHDRPPLPEIARALGVDAIIEGSVLRSGDRVRITAQLIHGSSDAHLWARNYEREVSDIF